MEIKYQIQLRWTDHPKGAEYWQTMNGVFKTRAAAEARLAKALASGDFTEGRVVEKAS